MHKIHYGIEMESKSASAENRHLSTEQRAASSNSKVSTPIIAVAASHQQPMQRATKKIVYFPLLLPLPVFNFGCEAAKLIKKCGSYNNALYRVACIALVFECVVQHFCLSSIFIIVYA